MALAALSGDEQCIIFVQLCNTLDPGVAVAFGSINSELWALTPALLQQLRADYEVATALCRKVGLRGCKELREAKVFQRSYLNGVDLATLGTLVPVLPALEILCLYHAAAGPDGVQLLAEGLGAGALPAVNSLVLRSMQLGDAGASALAAALGRGALPRLKHLTLYNTAIGDAGLVVALAPALRRMPAMEALVLTVNPFGNDGLAALLAPPPPAGTPPLPNGGLKKLKDLYLSSTQVTDAGCAALVAALDSGALPALDTLALSLHFTPASTAAKDAVREALAKSRQSRRAALSP